MKLIKEKSGKKVFKSEDGAKVLYCKEGEFLGENNTNPKEIICLAKGKISVTIEDEVSEFSAPQKIEIPQKTYHKIEVLENATFLLFIE